MLWRQTKGVLSLQSIRDVWQRVRPKSQWAPQATCARHAVNPQNFCLSQYWPTEKYWTDRSNQEWYSLVHLILQLSFRELTLTLTLLIHLNPHTSMGPDSILTWILQDFAPLLVPPLCAIYNSSIRESSLWAIWKSAKVVPIPKNNPSTSVQKDLRPVSLMPVLAKELEFFVCRWLMQLVDHHFDRSQYGAISNSSTMHALVDLLYDWFVATDSGDRMVRTRLLDCRKASDLMNHRLLLNKLCHLDLPTFIVSWTGAFLQDRHQWVRVREHVTAWLPVHGEAPQGTGRLPPDDKWSVGAPPTLWVCWWHHDLGDVLGVVWRLCHTGYRWWRHYLISKIMRGSSMQIRLIKSPVVDQKFEV